MTRIQVEFGNKILLFFPILDTSLDFCITQIKEEGDDFYNNLDSVCENGFFPNPYNFQHNFTSEFDSSTELLEEKFNKKSVHNVFQGDEVVVQAINTPGKQKPTYIYYDGYRFTKDSSRFCKGLQSEMIYWRCSTYKNTKLVSLQVYKKFC